MLFEKQDYQHECVQNILSLLSKVDVKKSDYSNLQNAIKAHYQEHHYTKFTTTSKAQLDVLMETGTGKTYTYLKTIFELHKEYGLKKFIIILPRVAIKLGVIQNIRLTDEHFYNEYKQHLRYIDYPQDGTNKIRTNFIQSDDIGILLLTASSFNNPKDNIIHRREERIFEHDNIWDAIIEKKPIVFIDEPHLLKGSKTTKALEKLKSSSLFMRFGATYPENEEHALCNVAYALDSISSFQKHLVKQIRVNTVLAESEQGAIRITEVQGTKQNRQIHCVYDKNQEIFQCKLGKDDDIGAKTGLDRYKGDSIVKATSKKVYVSDKTTLPVGSNAYTLNDEEIREMVHATIVKHFEKEEALFTKNIKAISLFFIPSIADFRPKTENEKPRIKTIFEEEYKTIRRSFYDKTTNESYKQYLDKDYVDGLLRVHEGYFSGDKGTKDEKEKQGVDIILRDKERLLSFDTPLRFVFSVWALQEGWDNPNVSTLCKLVGTNDTSRRQQVGRGLRLMVNQAGKRRTFSTCEENEEKFFTTNTLDVVVSAQEKEFIYAIQQEIQDASYHIVNGTKITVELLKQYVNDETTAARVYLALEAKNYISADGTEIKPIRDFFHSESELLAFLSHEERTKLQKAFAIPVRPVLDGNKKVARVCIRKDKWKEFQTLWKTINKKAHIVYKNIEDKKIITKVVRQFSKETIEKVKVRIETKKYNVAKNIIETQNVEIRDTVEFFKKKPYTDFLNDFVQKAKLPLHFVLNLCNELEKKGQSYKIKDNPKKAKEFLIKALEESIHGEIVNKITYQFTETTIYPNDLQDNEGKCEESIHFGILGRFFTEENVQDHLLYDKICYDSDIEKEIQQNEAQTTNGNSVKVFAKLPRIAIPTPYKTYSPDFAYLIETKDKKKLFLIVETKGYESEQDIKKEETQKIAYAKKFFKHLQEHVHDDIRICYKTRMNKQELFNIITECNNLNADTTS